MLRNETLPKTSVRSVDIEGGRAFQMKERIKQYARGDKKKRLDSLWIYLVQQYRNGDSDFSVAKIGRELEKRKILTGQGYRNAGGSDYRNIVEAFALEVGGRTSHWRAPSTTPLEQIIDALADADAAARLRLLLSEESKLRAENHLLRGQMRKMHTVPYGAKSLTNSKETEESPSSELKSVKSAPHVGALLRFLDEEWLLGNDLRSEADGTITHNGVAITLPRFFYQLRSVLEYLNDR